MIPGEDQAGTIEALQQFQHVAVAADPFAHVARYDHAIRAQGGNVVDERFESLAPFGVMVGVRSDHNSHGANLVQRVIPQRANITWVFQAGAKKEAYRFQYASV